MCHVRAKSWSTAVTVFIVSRNCTSKAENWPCRRFPVKKPVIKNRVEECIEQAVVQMAIDNPAWGQVRVSNELRKKGMLVSPGGVRSIWLRHDMETFQKHLKALSTKVEQEGIVLDENQVAALEKAKAEKQAHGEIETYYPGSLVAQDTYYVGISNGV